MERLPRTIREAASLLPVVFVRVVEAELFESSSYGVAGEFSPAPVAQCAGLDYMVYFVCQFFGDLERDVVFVV